MSQVTYLPDPDDGDEVVVDGITFKAYEPVELDPASKADLISKLGKNPWFARDDLDEAALSRKAQWVKVRGAQTAAKAHREHADALETNPDASGGLDLTTANDQAAKIVADAQAKADQIVADAKTQKKSKKPGRSAN